MDHVNWELLPDEGFGEMMEERVWPLLRGCCTERRVRGAGGAPISGRLYRAEGAKAVICISHGFTEFSDRYAEIIYMFLQAGYSVAICDHRSHGYSYRPLKNLSKVHVDSYDTFVEDYHCFVEDVKQEMPELRRFLFGHSMGGCIAALYIEKYPQDFEACILSSPMLQVVPAGAAPAAGLFARIMLLLGQGEKYLGSQDQDFKGDETFEQSCGTDVNRWSYWNEWKKADPMVQTCAGTIRWMAASLRASSRAVKQASGVQIPVLLTQAGKDHMVYPGGQNAFVKNCPGAKIRRYPEAKHEVTNCVEETRRPWWEDVLGFYSEQ